MSEKKVTIYDIAQKTNFSAVTVHRALNNKGRISEKTKTLILNAAESMGYKANPAAQGLRRSPIKIGAVLYCPVDEYVNTIIEGIEFGAQDLEKYNVSVDITRIPYTTGKECLQTACEKIRALCDNGCNGIILFLSAMMDETDELVSLVREYSQNSGVAFATVANDILGENRILHVGINAFMAGSMAAEMLEFSCKNKTVALLVSSNTSPINREYITGFRHYARDSVFAKTLIYEHFDDQTRVSEVTRRMLEENPDLSGIYMATASSALACRVLREKNRTDLSIITTDLLADTPALLEEKVANAAIFQNPFKQGKSVLTLLYNHITAKNDGGTYLLSPHILLSSNIKSYVFEK